MERWIVADSPLPSPIIISFLVQEKKVTIIGKMCHGLERWAPPKQTLREDSSESDSLGGVVGVLCVPMGGDVGLGREGEQRVRCQAE